MSKLFILVISLVIFGVSRGAPTTVKDSIKTFRFESFIQNGIDDSIPFFVSIDSNKYLLSDIHYDPYYKVIRGHLLRFKQKDHSYPYNLLILDDYSTLSNDFDQIRLLDILETRHLSAEQAGYRRKDFCQDRMIMTTGDTITCRIYKVLDGRIKYQKCSQKIKRIYGKNKDKLSKVIFHNGNTLEFDSPPAPKQNRDKTSYHIQLIGISLLMALLTGAGILIMRD